MKFSVYHLRRRCPVCKQLLRSKEPMLDQIAARQERQKNLAKILGHMPRTQKCIRCNKIVFEGEAGFRINPCLLIDCPALTLAYK